MARVIIKDDKIVKYTINPNLGIEVGELPKEKGMTVDLGRLRWDGEKIVDISTVPSADGFYVEQGTYELHVVPVQRSQKVHCAYKDRKHLYQDTDGKIKPKTQKQKNLEIILAYQKRRKAEYPPMDTQMGELMKFIADKFYDDPDMTPELKAVFHDIDVVKDKFPKPAPSASGVVIPSAAEVALKKPH
jgi:hypothetical protein